jgi:hypothetical protein
LLLSSGSHRRNYCVVDTKPVLAGDPFWPYLFIIDIDVKLSEEWLPCVTVSDPATSRVGTIARLPSVVSGVVAVKSFGICLWTDDHPMARNWNCQWLLLGLVGVVKGGERSKLK